MLQNSICVLKIARNFFKRGPSKGLDFAARCKNQYEDARPKDSKEFNGETTGTVECGSEEMKVANCDMLAAHEITISNSAESERRSKKAEDKVVICAPTPAANIEVKDIQSKDIRATSTDNNDGINKKPKKRLRRLVDDEDEESDDDLRLINDNLQYARAALEVVAEHCGVKHSTSDGTTAGGIEHAKKMAATEGKMGGDDHNTSDGENEDSAEEGKVDKNGQNGSFGDENVDKEVRLNSNIVQPTLESSRPPVKPKKSSANKSKVIAGTTKDILEEIRGLIPGYSSLPYRTLTNVLAAVESVTGRLEITDIIRELLVKTIECCPTDLPVLLYLLCGKIGPAYEATELGIGEKNIVDALVKSLGCSASSLNQKGEGADGDLGTAAQRAKASQRTLNFGANPPPLTCQHVLQSFRDIAMCSGGRSMNQKISIIRKLLMRCGKEGDEVKFLVRGLQTKLRCRLAEPTVLTALAQSFVESPREEALLARSTKSRKTDHNKSLDKEDIHGPHESEPSRNDFLVHALAVLRQPTANRVQKWEAAEAIVKQAYSECPNYDRLIDALISAPLTDVLRSCRLSPGVPVKPMLAKPQDSFQEVLRRMQGLHFTMEYKYDGERAQVHLLQDGSFKIFSRNSEDTTTKYPDLLPILREALQPTTTSFVIDAEAVAVDPVSGKLLPFQVLSTRKRKNEKAEDVKVQVVLFVFDILYLNDRPILHEPLIQRRALLRRAFNSIPGKFDFAISLDHHENGDTSPIEAFLDEAIAGNCEGLMVKTLEQNATYEPTKRSLNWLKLKKDYLSSNAGPGGRGPADSLDLVVLGANHGQGKRAGWYGAFLLACYDQEAEEYQSVCKIGTGFSEEFLAAAKPQLDFLILSSGKPDYYNTSLECDVWFDPKIVWEVRAADLSLSPAHKGAIDKVEKGKGIALRFPRFIRERADKASEDATSSEQIADAYRSQALVEATLSAGRSKFGQEEDDWCI